VSFRICQPGSFTRKDALQPGEVSIAKNATLTALAIDLEAVKIQGEVVLLVDPDNWRLGLKAPSADEGSLVVSVAPTSAKHDRGRRRIGLRPALRELNITAEVCAGRYQLHQHKEPLLLYIVITDTATKGQRQLQARSEPKAKGGQEKGK